MRLCFTTRKLTSWMATLAILMVALAPSFLHAMAPKQLPIPSEICVSTGVRQVQLGASPEQSPPPQDLHHFEHCPCCSVHGHAVALPSVVSSRPLLLSCAHELPRTFLAAPRTPHAWVAAKPRGPPAFA